MYFDPLFPSSLSWVFLDAMKLQCVYTAIEYALPVSGATMPGARYDMYGVSQHACVNVKTLW